MVFDLSDVLISYGLGMVKEFSLRCELMLGASYQPFVAPYDLKNIEIADSKSPKIFSMAGQHLDLTIKLL